MIGRLDGHYDDTGHWKRTKFCFMSCGARCTCGPPGGLFYNPLFDKTHEQKELPLSEASLEAALEQIVKSGVQIKAEGPLHIVLCPKEGCVGVIRKADVGYECVLCGTQYTKVERPKQDPLRGISMENVRR
jgi:hypothetical protein